MRQEPLYRTVNTRTHHVRHGGGDYRHERHTARADDAASPRGSMHGKQRHGRDYTPLFRWLLSRVGRDFDDVMRDVRPRLDDTAPVFWLVARTEGEQREIVRIGESSYFSGLYVDEAGLLQRVNPALRASDMVPSCACCTHTFNGERFGGTAIAE